MSTALVFKVDTEDGTDGFIADIHIARHAALRVQRPKAIDLPEDIRVGLRAWLDEADKEVPS